MMLLTRYFVKDILKTTSIIAVVLFFVFLSYLTKGYFEQLATGLITPNLLLPLFLLQIPLLLSTILPLSLFLGILIVYRRLDMNNERLAAFASGLSYTQLTRITLSSIGVTVLIVSIIMLWLKPHLYWAERQLLTKSYHTLPAIQPGQFLTLQDGKTMIYASQVNPKGELIKLLIAHQLPTSAHANNPPPTWQIITANKAYKKTVNQNQSFIVFENGYRYKIIPGQKAGEKVHYEKYFQSLPNTLNPENASRLSASQRVKYLPTPTLWRTAGKDPFANTELQWRFSLPLSVILLTLLTLPMSHHRPGSKGSLKLILAILIYIGYMDMLLLGRAWMKKGLLPGLGLGWIHGAMIVLLLTLYCTYFLRVAKTRK